MLIININGDENQEFAYAFYNNLHFGGIPPLRKEKGWLCLSIGAAEAM
jgi:hypothetical protein